MKTLKYLFACLLVIAFASFAIAAEVPGPTLLGLNGVLKVGVFEPPSTLGFIEYKGPKAVHAGLEVDLAKALATAVGANQIEWVPSALSKRLTDLDDGTTDVAYALVTWVFQGRDVLLPESQKGYEFGPVYYYDGTNVMINPNITPEAGTNVIVADGTVSLDDLNRLYTSGRWPADWNYPPIIVEDSEPGADDAYTRAENGFLAGSFEGEAIHAYCTDESALISLKIKNLPDSAAWEIYGPFVGNPIGKSPLTVAMKEGDENWSEVVSAVFFVLLTAEELQYGNGSTSIPELAANGLPPSDWGPTVPGLAPGWAREVIKKHGNYGEMWERNLGKYEGAFSRGLNNLWNHKPDPGLMFAPPF